MRYSPFVMSPEDVERALECCPDTAAGLRARALIGLLYRTGMVISEAIALNTADVHMLPGEESVAIAGGHLKPRTLALDSSAVALVTPWLEARRTMPGDALLCITYGKTQGARWSEGSARHGFVPIAAKAGWARLVPGDFRHSFAAELMVEQWPIPYIQAQLGTTSLRAFEHVFKHLGIRIPPASEVQPIIRMRHWARQGTSP